MQRSSYSEDSRKCYHTHSSDSTKNDLKHQNLHILCSYIIAAVFIAIFAMIYNHFGHGVESPFMNFAWVWPALGAACALVFLLRKKPLTEPGRVFLACGIATLTVGFLLEGVFAIAGTGSVFMPIFFFVGAGLLLLSVISLLLY